VRKSAEGGEAVVFKELRSEEMRAELKAFGGNNGFASGEATNRGVDQVPSSSTEAEKLLAELGRELQSLAGRELRCRMKLGELLLQIQRGRLYTEFRKGFDNWTDFLENGFPRITGLQIRSAYDAISLGQSPTLRRLPDSEKSQIKSVANARTITRLERNNVEVTPETISSAKELPSAEFKRKVGVSRGHTVSVWVQDAELAAPLQRIMEMLKGLTPDAARHLAEFLESVDLTKRAGDGIDNKLDLIISMCNLEFQREEAELEDQERSRFLMSGDAR